jgi:CRISPR-associated protein Csx3
MAHSQLPAIVIGGPPHSGKSVLLGYLTDWLRRERIDHYVLRACPDGEGDWFQRDRPEIVRSLRYKGEWTNEWVDQMCKAIAGRQVPLLVDMGGRPSEYQLRILSACTHAVLLTKDEESRAHWLSHVDKAGLILLADLESSLDGPSEITKVAEPLCARFVGMKRQHALLPANQPAFELLAYLLRDVFVAGSPNLRVRQMQNAPSGFHAWDIEEMAGMCAVEFDPLKGFWWSPADLAALFNRISGGKPTARYGRSAAWITAAVAAHALPAACRVFDPRYEEWPLIQEYPCESAKVARSRRATRVRNRSPLETSYISVEALHILFVQIRDSWLEPISRSRIVLPELEITRGVIISGKLPVWLFADLTVTYINAGLPWVATYDANTHKSIVVASRNNSVQVGHVLDLALTVSPASSFPRSSSKRPGAG